MNQLTIFKIKLGHQCHSLFFFHDTIMISNMMAVVVEVIQYINHVKSMLE